MLSLGGGYIQILGAGALLLAFRYFANSVLSSLGKTSITMYATIVMAVVNIILNFIAIFLFEMTDVKIIALTSIVSWLFSVLVSFGYLIIFHRTSVFTRFAVKRVYGVLKPVLNIAIPSVLEPFSWHLAQVTIIAMVVQLGEIALATRVYTFNVIFIIAIFGTAISYGIQIKVAHFLGANALERAQHYLVTGVRNALIVVIFIMPVIILFSDHLIGIFTADSAILSMAKDILIIAFFTEIGRTINLIVGACLKASGDAKFVSFCGIAFMGLVSVPMCYLLGIHFSLGFIGIAIGLALDECLRGLLAIFRWRNGNWRRLHLHAKS